jgi:hypothetical protein
MSSNDLEGNTSALARHTLLLGPRKLCCEAPIDIFSQGIEKEYCNSGLWSCFSSPDAYHFAESF